MSLTDTIAGSSALTDTLPWQAGDTVQRGTLDSHEVEQIDPETECLTSRQKKILSVAIAIAGLALVFFGGLLGLCLMFEAPPVINLGTIAVTILTVAFGACFLVFCRMVWKAKTPDEGAPTERPVELELTHFTVEVDAVTFEVEAEPDSAATISLLDLSDTINSRTEVDMPAVLVQDTSGDTLHPPQVSSKRRVSIVSRNKQQNGDTNTSKAASKIQRRYTCSPAQFALFGIGKPKDDTKSPDTSLHLTEQHLKDIPADVLARTDLTRLDLTKNDIRKLPDTIGDMVTLTRLCVGMNQLTELPKTIGKLINLTVLYAMDNQLTDLHYTLGLNVKGLEVLDVSNNRIPALPTSLRNLKELKQLAIAGNPLIRLPDWLCEFPKLETLLIDSSQLHLLPKGFDRNKLTVLSKS